jgi:hypothetical protein
VSYIRSLPAQVDLPNEQLVEKRFIHETLSGPEQFIDLVSLHAPQEFVLNSYNLLVRGFLNRMNVMILLTLVDDLDPILEVLHCHELKSLGHVHLLFAHYHSAHFLFTHF